jgi:hypothetical protein
MVGCIPKIDENGFRVANVKIAIWLWWESGAHYPTGSSEVLVPEARVELWILPWLMKLTEETFFEDRFSRRQNVSENGHPVSILGFGSGVFDIGDFFWLLVHIRKICDLG